MKTYIIFGAPGVGKGTQATILSKNLHYLHLSTGQMLRDAVKEKSELGKKVGKIIDGGNLIPDNMISEIIDSFLEKNKNSKGIILDGYPRTLKQCPYMDSYAKKYNLDLEIINLTADYKELTKRLLKRAEIEKRKDDNLETIEKRIKIYEKETSPILKHYQGRIPIYNVDGIGTVDEVSERIFSSINFKN